MTTEQYVITNAARTSLLGGWTFRATPVKDGDDDQMASYFTEEDEKMLLGDDVEEG